MDDEELAIFWVTEMSGARAWENRLASKEDCWDLTAASTELTAPLTEATAEVTWLTALTLSWAIFWIAANPVETAWISLTTLANSGE